MEFFIGINIVRYSYLAELSPVKERGIIYLWLETGSTLDIAYSVICAYFILDELDTGNW
jgi:hypothetical protein